MKPFQTVGILCALCIASAVVLFDGLSRSNDQSKGRTFRVDTNRSSLAETDIGTDQATNGAFLKSNLTYKWPEMVPIKQRTLVLLRTETITNRVVIEQAPAVRGYDEFGRTTLGSLEYRTPKWGDQIKTNYVLGYMSLTGAVEIITLTK